MEADKTLHNRIALGHIAYLFKIVDIMYKIGGNPDENICIMYNMLYKCTSSSQLIITLKN